MDKNNVTLIPKEKSVPEIIEDLVSRPGRWNIVHKSVVEKLAEYECVPFMSVSRVTSSWFFVNSINYKGAIFTAADDPEEPIYLKMED